jgi:LPXTG-motif cell wall-anchored protein
MNMRNLAIAAGAVALGLATLSTVNAQGPLYDKVLVNLPYSVTIGGRTLQPGEYQIRQMPSAGNSRVLLIYSDNGMKFETSAMTIPTLDNRTPEDTKVVLHHFGPDYYFDKIWIQGKNYGYEFPLPDSVKARERERMEPLNVAARYEAVPAENNQNQTTTAAQTTTEQQTTTQNQTTTAQTTPAPAETTTAQNTPAPAETTTAQNTPPAATQNNTVAQNTTPMPSSTVSSADRTMPATSANWLMMLLGGGMLSGAGLTLRRRK